MIKSAAAAGAVAWTAPVIIDSLASPAAALTAPPGCRRLIFTADASCTRVATLQCTKCGDPTCPSGSWSTDGSTAISAFGLQFTGACNGTFNATIVGGSSCVILQGAKNLPNNNGATCCNGNIVTPSAGGKSITFTSPTGVIAIWLSC
jgi:hypothetical protein